MESRNLAFHFCLPPFDTYQHFDNFAVRTLSGDYDVAPGEVTRQHLEKAKGDRAPCVFWLEEVKIGEAKGGPTQVLPSIAA